MKHLSWKKVTSLILVLLAIAMVLCSCGSKTKDQAASVVEDSATVQKFTDEAVDPEDLNKILRAGINAPSGMNEQPWHFSVITDKSVMEQINKDIPVPGGKAMPDKANITSAPVAIVVSARDDKELDAGLATQAMCDEAQILGYGTKILGSTAIALNGEKEDSYKKLLGIPDDMEHVCVVLVGHPAESSDADTQATPRNSFSSNVTFIKAG